MGIVRTDKWTRYQGTIVKISEQSQINISSKASILFGKKPKSDVEA